MDPKRHEEKSITAGADEWLRRAPRRSLKAVGKAINSGDYDAVVKALKEGDHKIIEAATS